MASVIKIPYTNKKGQTKDYFAISYRDIYGKQHTAGGRYTKRADAEKHLHEYESTFGTENKITVEELFNCFWKKVNKYEPGTQYNYKVYYNRYFKDMEKRRYKSLTVPMLQDFFDKIEKESAYSAQYCLKMFKAAVNNGIKKQLIKENNLIYLDPIKLPVADKNRHLNLKEANLLLDYAENNLSKEGYTLIYIMLGTGMRFGETAALNKSDINLEDMTLEVTKQFTKGLLKYMLKTDSSYRTVYFFDDLAEVLSDYMKDVEGEILFPNTKGTYINNDNFRDRVWKPFLNMVGIKKRTRLHDLRGSYVDIMLSKGVSPKFIQNNIGHSTMDMTLGWYAKNNAEMIEFARQKGNEAFSTCNKNVMIKPEPTKSNVIPFPKRAC